MFSYSRNVGTNEDVFQERSKVSSYNIVILPHTVAIWGVAKRQQKGTLIWLLLAFSVQGCKRVCLAL